MVQGSLRIAAVMQEEEQEAEELKISPLS